MSGCNGTPGNHHPATTSSRGEIELTTRFSEEMYKLCENDCYSDVTFIVDGSRFPAHRVILAARSEYFRALLFGGLSESTQDEIHLELPLVAFKALLKYIYSGRMSLNALKDDHILDTLGLADHFGFTELQVAISEYLVQVLAVSNCCKILDAARLFNLDHLTQLCHTFIDRNAKDLLAHPSFLHVSKDSLCAILARDSFFAPEVDIFLAVREWCSKNGDANVASAVQHVRLSLMKLEQLLHEVRSSGIIESDRLLDAINERTTSKRLPYRGALWPEENVASAKFDSKTIEGDLRSCLLDGDTVSYDCERGFTRHPIREAAGERGILVELGTISILNHVKLLLWDRDNRSYSYYIEVSVNRQNWDCVVDYQPYWCRSWQHLYFAPRAVKYIRLVGTHNTTNREFHVVALEAMYTANVPALLQDIIVPTTNVASIDRSASVIEGVSRSRNVLLDGDVSNYDWDSGYTCHQLGSGSILIQLGQPYIIGSLRLLLWDLDDRTYKLYIETSVNNEDWELLVDRRDEHMRSWQQFTFKPRPIVFIKIVGTENTANEIFHCVHFECPAQDAQSKAALELELGGGGKGEQQQQQKQQQQPGMSVALPGKGVEKDLLIRFELLQQLRRPMTANELKRFSVKGQQQQQQQQHQQVGVEEAVAAVAIEDDVQEIEDIDGEVAAANDDQ